MLASFSEMNYYIFNSADFYKMNLLSSLEVIAMLHKKHTIPSRLLLDQALMRRINYDHPAYPTISRNHNWQTAGYKGELGIEFYLRHLPQENLHIFHNLRLPNDSDFFEMDTLLLTPYFALIIEIKNIAGTLYFDTISNQLIRDQNGKETGFPSPILQVEEHKDNFEKWLFNQFKIDSFPIHYLVAISEQETIIDVIEGSDREGVFQKVMHFPSIKKRYLTLLKQHPRKNVKAQTLHKIIPTLLHQHRPFHPAFPSLYSLKPTDILSGIYCNACKQLTMKRMHGKWLCYSCGQTSLDAHIEAIDDFLLLVDRKITTRQCMAFIQIDNRHLANRLLINSSLISVGKKKGRYFVKEPE